MRVTWEEKDIRAGLRYGKATIRERFIIGYDPATGAELWRTKGLESNTIATPLVGHGRWPACR